MYQFDVNIAVSGDKQATRSDNRGEYMNEKPWDKKELDYLIKMYPTKSTEDIGRHLNKSMTQVKSKAHSLIKEGLIKPIKTKHITEKVTLHLAECNIPCRVGDMVILKGTQKGDSHKEKYKGEVIYKDDKLMTIKTRKYNISVLAVDLKIGNWELMKEGD